MRQYWAYRSKPYIKPYGPLHCVGPFDTREAAIAAAFAQDERTIEVGSGYGTTGAIFDIRWNRRESK